MWIKKIFYEHVVFFDDFSDSLMPVIVLNHLPVSHKLIIDRYEAWKYSW